MLSPQLSAEVRKFCETTSVRGVPRIVKSKSTGLFVIWLIGVLTCAGLLLWQLVVVFKRYASYPVNTLLVQAPAWDNATFPDITVCNLCSLIHENERSMTYKDYSSVLTSTLTYTEYRERFGSTSNLTEDDFNSSLQYLLTPMAYFNNFHIIEFEKDNITSPILDCNYFNWDYSGNYNTTYCYASMQPIFDPFYYKCYTSKLSDVNRKQFRAFSAIFYVHDFRESQMANYTVDILNPRSTGLRVMIHPPGTVPDMKLGMNVGPGTDTIITLTQTTQMRLPDPYSNCTNERPHGLQFPTYTQDFCYDVCYQNQYLKTCGCISIDFQFTGEQLEESNGTFCGNLAISNNAGNNINWDGVRVLLQCVATINLDTNTCAKECVLPCQELKYAMSLSSAPWPHISAQLSFYESYIRGQSRFGDAYNEYQTIHDLAYSNATVATSLLEKLNNEGLIQKNFLQLTVRFDSSSYNVQHDVAAVPLDALGAQIGGVLSLWLGVTIILIFELCEFVYNLICLCKNANNMKPFSSITVGESKLRVNQGTASSLT